MIGCSEKWHIEVTFQRHTELPLPLGSTAIASKEIAAASAAIWTLSCQHQSRSNGFLMMSTSRRHIRYRFHGSQTGRNPGLSHLLAPFQTLPCKTCIVLSLPWHLLNRSFPMLPQASWVWRRLAPARIHQDSSFMDTSGCNFYDDEAHLFGSWQWPSMSTSTMHNDRGSRWDKLECDIPWFSQLLPGLKVAKIHPCPSHIFLHHSDVPACSISVILATTDTQSCLLVCSCPNACQKYDSGATRLGMRWLELYT